MSLETKIEALDAQYFVVTIKGKVRVGKIGPDGLELMTERDFKLREANKLHLVTGPKGGETILSVADKWLKYPDRRTFDGIDLAPGGEFVLPGNRLNIYRGWGVTPKKGCWQRLEDHIYEVLASGNSDHGDYIVWWCAWAVQNPGERAEAALVLRGERGAGKGILGNAMREIFGPHGVHIASEDHFTGRFQAHLENCLYLFADEAFWGGNKKGAGALQAKITEPTVMVEKKGIDQFEMPNRLHILGASDKDWAMPAGKHERRYAMPTVSSRYCRGVCPDSKREAYFGPLIKELYEDGGLAAFMWDLQNAYDLKGWGWHPRQIIETEELRRQQKLGMQPLEHWWEHLLQVGELPRRPGFETASIKRIFADPQYASSQALRDSAAEFDPKLRDVSFQVLGSFLEAQKAFPRPSNAFQGWKVLPLAQHRADWERKFGPRNWGMNRAYWGQSVMECDEANVTSTTVIPFKTQAK